VIHSNLPLLHLLYTFNMLSLNSLIPIITIHTAITMILQSDTHKKPHHITIIDTSLCSQLYDYYNDILNIPPIHLINVLVFSFSFVTMKFSYKLFHHLTPSTHAYHMRLSMNTLFISHTHANSIIPHLHLIILNTTIV